MTLVIQEERRHRTAIGKARHAAIIGELLPDANRVTRRPVPARHLMLGLQCGGSDGFSGITANPALGAAADFWSAMAAPPSSSETPEIYGAEHML